MADHRKGLATTTAALVFVVLATSADGGCQGQEPPPPSVTIGKATIEVEVAGTPAELAQGLSGRASLPPGTGMMFLFELGATPSFWMKAMRFPLDVVWIGDGCEVVDITLKAPFPPPGSDDSDLRRYTSAVQAAYMLEINAGETGRLGIAVGDSVSFSGVLVERARC